MVLRHHSFQNLHHHTINLVTLIWCQHWAQLDTEIWEASHQLGPASYSWSKKPWTKRCSWFDIKPDRKTYLLMQFKPMHQSKYWKQSLVRFWILLAYIEWQKSNKINPSQLHKKQPNWEANLVKWPPNPFTIWLTIIYLSNKLINATYNHS